MSDPSPTAVNPLEVLSGGEYSLPENPKLLRILVVQTARVVATELLSRRDEYSEKISNFLDALPSEEVRIFNQKFRKAVDDGVASLEAKIVVIDKHRRDWTSGFAQSKAGLSFLEGLGLEKKTDA